MDHYLLSIEGNIYQGAPAMQIGQDSFALRSASAYLCTMEKFSYWQLFVVFAKIGTFTIGGGYAMIPVIEKELGKRGWIGANDLDDIVVLAQSAPGLLAVNMAIYAGYKVSGVRGSIVATIGAVIPSFLIILLIAMFFTNFKDNEIVRRIFQGIRPVAVALILVPAVNMAKKGCTNWWTWLIAAVTLGLVAFLKVSPIWIIIVIIVCAAGITTLRQKK